MTSNNTEPTVTLSAAEFRMLMIASYVCAFDPLPEDEALCANLVKRGFLEISTGWHNGVHKLTPAGQRAMESTGEL